MKHVVCRARFQIHVPRAVSTKPGTQASHVRWGDETELHAEMSLAVAPDNLADSVDELASFREFEINEDGCIPGHQASGLQAQAGVAHVAHGGGSQGTPLASFQHAGL